MASIHATCVALGPCGVLLLGPSGSGKSDLALRLIDDGAALVADDQVEIAARDGCLIASAPSSLAGRLEVRGVGIVEVAHCRSAPVALAVDLVDTGSAPRLPEGSLWHHQGIGVPRIALVPFEASAPAKVRLAVRTATHDSDGRRKKPQDPTPIR